MVADTACFFFCDGCVLSLLWDWWMRHFVGTILPLDIPRQLISGEDGRPFDFGPFMW